MPRQAEGSPKDGHREPKAPQRETKRAKGIPKGDEGSPRAPNKGTQRETKGAKGTQATHKGSHILLCFTMILAHLLAKMSFILQKIQCTPMSFILQKMQCTPKGIPRQAEGTPKDSQREPKAIRRQLQASQRHPKGQPDGAGACRRGVPDPGRAHGRGLQPWP